MPDSPRGVTIRIEGDGNLMGALLEGILQLIRESGANDVEAKCALAAATAMLPDLGLRQKPDFTIS